VILDTGDNYLLVQQGRGYAVALGLYAEMEASVLEIPTGLRVSVEAAEFVYATLGRVFAYGFADTDASIRIDIPSRLIEDAGKAADLFRAHAFWENLQFPARPKRLLAGGAPQLRLADLKAGGGSGCSSSRTDGDHLIAGDTRKHSGLHIQTPWEIVAHDDFRGSRIVFHVLFNTIYRLALVVDAASLASCGGVARFQRAFPDFELATTFATPEGVPDVPAIPGVESAFRAIFHKRTFGTADDIRAKHAAFRALYNLDERGGGAGVPAGVPGGVPVAVTAAATAGATEVADTDTERDRVAALLRRDYEVSDDADAPKRIKANDLYKEFINLMLIPYDDAAAFKKRLAGYLVELSLKKKRFSDAYYYYGIVRKPRVRVTTEDLLARRASERRAWIAEGTFSPWGKDEGGRPLPPHSLPPHSLPMDPTRA
jgi:hypothetical protein